MANMNLQIDQRDRGATLMTLFLLFQTPPVLQFPARVLNLFMLKLNFTVSRFTVIILRTWNHIGHNFIICWADRREHYGSKCQVLYF